MRGRARRAQRQHALPGALLKPSLDARGAVNLPVEFEPVNFGGASGTSSCYFRMRDAFAEGWRIEAEYRMALALKVSREDI